MEWKQKQPLATAAAVCVCTVICSQKNCQKDKKTQQNVDTTMVERTRTVILSSFSTVRDNLTFFLPHHLGRHYKIARLLTRALPLHKTRLKSRDNIRNV